MDAILASPQSGPAQQIPPQPVSVSQSQEPGAKPNLRKFFNISSWIVFFALLPVTVLIFLSQNTVPGDLFYPVKRSMESVILAAASVSPATRAAFRTDLTTRRFDEAEKLLLGASGTTGLKDFVTEIQAAQNEVSAISDPVKKEKLQQKIQTSVTEYEKRLDTVKVKLIAQEETNQLAFVPTNTPIPVATSEPGEQPIPTNTPSPLSTSTPKPPVPSNPPTTTIITPTKAQPTNIPIQTSALTQIPNTPTSIPQPTLAPSITPGGGTIAIVDDVSKYLRCLQNTPAPHRECTPPEIKSESPKEDKIDKRSEERLRREGELEKRKKALEERKNEEEEKLKEKALESDKKESSSSENSKLENTR